MRLSTFTARYKNRLSQSGLIYLAPATIVPVLTLAYVKGEFWRFFFFSDEYEKRIALRWDGDESESESESVSELEEDGQGEADYHEDIY